MEKMQLKHTAELGLIGGMARLKLSKGMKRGRIKSQLKRLDKTVTKEMRKKAISLDDVEVAWNIIKKFLRDTGWEKKSLKTITLTQFCKALIAQSDMEFSARIQGILDDIEDYYDRAGKLQAINIWPADLACRKWLAIWGIHEEEGLDSHDRLKAIDDQIARANALKEYQARFYPETIKEAV